MDDVSKPSGSRPRSGPTRRPVAVSRLADSAAAPRPSRVSPADRASTVENGPQPAKFAGLLRDSAAFAGLLLAAGLVATIVGTAATAQPVALGIPEPGALVRFGIPVLRFVLDLGAVSTTGLSLLPRLIGFDRPERSESILRVARRAAVWTSVAWGLSALLTIVLLTVELGGRPTPAGIWQYIVAIAAGKGLLMSAGCALLSLWLAKVAVKHGEQVPAELRAGVALFGLLPLPLTGHAANWSYHDLSMISMELHVVAATAWAGGLGAVVIFLARKPGLLAEALPRFSKLATWCVLLVGVTGIFNGLLELALSPITTLPGSLFTTRYGVLVLAKAACMVLVALVAVRVRRRILPMVTERKNTAIAVWCGLELIVLAVAFGVAVVLTRTSVTTF